MAQMPDRDSTNDNKKGFFSGRNIATIGCLLIIIFVIALVVVIFFGGALFSIPHDEGVSPGP